MTPGFFLAVQIVVVAAGIACAAILLRHRIRAREAIGPLDVAWAGAAAIAGTGVATFLSLGLGVGFFGTIRMIYLAGVVGIPLVGLGLVVLAATRRVRIRALAWPVVALGLAAAPVGAWTSFVGPYDLRVERTEVRLSPRRAGAAPIRIGVLADLQCDSVGAPETAAVEALLAEKPDLILVPGDLFQPQFDRLREWKRVREPLVALLARVRAPHGVYFVPGDVDAADSIGAVRDGTDWRVLLDETVTLRIRDRIVTIAGAMNRASHALARDLERRPGDEDVRILLTHAPDAVLAMDGPPRVDLVVTGHTHGGQVVLPGFGPLMTLSSVPRRVAAGGLHVLRGRHLYVSRGIGMERNQAPPMRFLCPPEVSVLTLVSPPSDRP